MTRETAADLVRAVSIYRLCDFGGCLCGHCAIKGIQIDISCRKSSVTALASDIHPGFYGITLRVHDRSLDRNIDDLTAVADEVARQLAAEGYAIFIRFCEDEVDRKRKCTYCGHRREDIRGYLCNECMKKDHPLGGGKLADDYDLRQYDKVVSAVERNEVA